MDLLRKTLGFFVDAAWLRRQPTLHSDLYQDLRYGARRLWKNPGFTTVAVLALALGIGANTAIFSVIHALLFRPLPFADPDELVMVWEHNRPRNNTQNVVGPANFLAWQQRNGVFDKVAAIAAGNANLTGGEEPEKVSVAVVSADFFPILGVAAARGRTFLPQEVERGDDVVVISHGLWQRRFGENPDLVGKSLLINGEPQTVLGIMPHNFEIPSKAEIWAPMMFTEQHRTHTGRYMLVIARLKTGISSQQAQAAMDTIAIQLEGEFPDRNAGWGVNIVPLQEQIAGPYRGALFVLLGAVGLVLLIACANVSNLLLGRAAERQRELALRTALGAPRQRLVRQMLTESLLLALVGGLSGLFLAHGGLRGILAILPSEIPPYIEIGLSGRVLFFTLGLSLATAILFGLIPALAASRTDLHETLKEGGRGNGHRTGMKMRSLLVVSEVALSLVLLIGAGLLSNSFYRLLAVHPGFNAEDLMTCQVSLPGSKYGQDHQQRAFFEQAVERLGGLADVESVGAVSFLPIATLGAATRFSLPDRPAAPAGEEPVANVRAVAGDYFQTMAIPLLRGRLFDSRDTPDSPRVVIINKTLADQYWPTADPVGKRIRMSWGEVLDAEVIGIVGNVLHTSLDGQPRATLYWPHPQFVYNFMTLVIRFRGTQTAVTSAVRNQIRGLDPDLPVYNIRLMDEVLSESLQRPRFALFLLSLFSALALALAVLGIYGVVSYSVTLKTREIGIRMALGAPEGRILRGIVGRGVWLTTLGVALGLGGAMVLNSVLENMVFGIATTDSATFGSVTVFLFSVAMLACYLPARRAMKVDPITALH